MGMFNFNRQQSPDMRNSGGEENRRLEVAPLSGADYVFALSLNQDDLNYINEVLSQHASTAVDSDRLVNS